VQLAVGVYLGGHAPLPRGRAVALANGISSGQE
jgi:hypothetical protein